MENLHSRAKELRDIMRAGAKTARQIPAGEVAKALDRALEETDDVWREAAADVARQVGVTPTRPSGTISVTLTYREPTGPLPVDDIWGDDD